MSREDFNEAVHTPEANGTVSGRDTVVWGLRSTAGVRVPGEETVLTTEVHGTYEIFSVYTTLITQYLCSCT